MKDFLLSVLALLYFTLPVLAPFLYVACTVITASMCVLFLGKFKYVTALSVVLGSLSYALRDSDIYWVYKDYCDQLGGLKVYAPPEDWSAADGFSHREASESRKIKPDYRLVRRREYHMQSNLHYVVEYYSMGRGIEMEVESIIDSDFEVVLMEDVDFSRKQPDYDSRFWDASIFMYWLFYDTCVSQTNRYAWLHDGKSFTQYMTIYSITAEGRQKAVDDK